MTLDIRTFSAALNDLVTENRHLRRELGMAHLDLDPDLRDKTMPQAPAAASEPGTTASDVAARAAVVVQTALAEWNLPVLEPKGPNWQRIGSLYIKGLQGLGWTWEKDYTHDGQFAWCGAFAAYCYGAAGLQAGIRKSHMASCYRLYDWAKDTPRKIRDWKDGNILPGDIVVVGNEKSKAWGAHITLCQTFDAARSVVHTIEGNAHGTLPSGAVAEGVITNARPLATDDAGKYRVMHVYRMLAEDYEQEPA